MINLKNFKKQQKIDGSFISLTSDQKKFSKTKQSETIFLTALILDCLNCLETGDEIEKIKKKAANFLLKQKNENWSFNYWKRESETAKKMPYPDDLDDTFCTLSALFNYDSKILNGSALAKVVTILTAVEKKEGGPYQTWIVPKEAEKVWKDVDVAVNANVAYFLATQEVFLPNIRKFLFNKIEKRDLVSKYYPTIFPVVYFLARYLSLDKKTPEKIKQNLKQLIWSNKEEGKNWGNPLNTALAVSSLIRLEEKTEKLEKSISYLMGKSRGSLWKEFTFCCDPTIKGKPFYAGSKALTTVFCLEAIFLFNKANAQKSEAVEEKPKNQEMEKIYREVVIKVKQRFDSLQTEIKGVALEQLDKMLKKDKDKQVVLMPYFFALSLDLPQEKISYNFMVALGMANLYGWIAYTIYDDFLDNEGKIDQLSVANLCLRELTIIFNGVLPKETGFADVFRQIIDTLDAANTWEVTHCRFDPKQKKIPRLPNYRDYGRLADRSLGHALGPIAVLMSLGFSKDSLEVTEFVSFFRHYIIARQLNDDAHDWEKDLLTGQINAVGVEILKDCPKKSEKETIEAMPNLQKIFWFKTFGKISRMVLKHTSLAKEALDNNLAIKNTFLLKKLIASVENAVEIGIKEQEESIKFLKAYES